MKTIYLGAGEFWAPEAVYKKIRGVQEVVPGYMGGVIPNPSYEAVASGTTGHAEVVQVTYDETLISTAGILRVFYALHDPAFPQHPGMGPGSQYRSVIFYKHAADGEASDPGNGEEVGVIPRTIEEVQMTLPSELTIPTQVMSVVEFYPAEEYHYDFYIKNPDSPYVITVILPLLEKIKTLFPHLFLP